ncbi:hypothetical protein HYH03_002632 [Edaphochlamys debaryana]|uniref:Uncharacterized protein n=1 Tax=Edaphochlamys debaryana TaxID=47281 RepID=A0A835YB62_9CHLO|nr:hypothetical protein HYH03_002632 [Edaphochlamys debaryana]|eukprot:KAG2499697.1 hypothetical protein HYH03_002632 [Edaphochlamys debaryana]
MSEPEESSGSTPLVSKMPGQIEHRPRQKAKPPGMRHLQDEAQPEPKPEPAQQPVQITPTVHLTREQVNHAYDILEAQRVGPTAVRYACLGSIGAMAYTYATGFYHLANKNKELWQASFRHRMFIAGPVIAAYITANDVIPVPYKREVEAWLGRPAIAAADISAAKQTIKQAKAMPLNAQQ